MNDTGFYEMSQPCSGSHVVIRRDGFPSTGDIRFSIYNLRLYQTPNALLEFLGVATVSAPPSLVGFEADNLITNPSSRTSGNNLKPLIDSAGNRAAYESCYKTTDAELAPLGDVMVITIDFGKSIF